MRLFGWQLSISKGSRPLPEEVVTALSQVDGFDRRLREMSTRLETVYRKVYRDVAKGNGEADTLISSEVLTPKIIRPGDPL